MHGWWRTTERVGWEDSEFEAECKFENERWVEICDRCRRHLWHPENRPMSEPHSSTGTHTEYGSRWIFVGHTQDPLQHPHLITQHKMRGTNSQSWLALVDTPIHGDCEAPGQSLGHRRPRRCWFRKQEQMEVRHHKPTRDLAEEGAEPVRQKEMRWVLPGHC
jgi:hypothetical protein